MAQTADLILVNGRVETMAGKSFAAIACSGEHVLATGSDADMLELGGPRSDVVDLQGRLVLPAFADSHMHFVGYAAHLGDVDLKGVTSLEEVGRRVAEAAARKPDSWIIGRGWQHDLWGGTQPTYDVLDRAAPGRLVVLWRNDMHAVWVSGEAMRVAGIDAEASDPPGGHIRREANGTPSGVLSERAVQLITSILPASSVEDLAKAVKVAEAELHRAGIGAITSMEGYDAYRAFLVLRERGELGVRANVCLTLADYGEAVALLEEDGLGDDWLRWGQLKLFADGAMGARTAWMLAPYEDDPMNTGVCVTPPDELRRLIGQAAEKGVACAVHAIGDAANRAVLDAFAATAAIWQSRGLRQRVEHAQILATSDIARFGRLGVVASMQPIHATQDMVVADRALGERARGAYAFRALSDSGVTLAFGSDCPVESLDVLSGLYAATARKRADGYPEGGWYPEQRITMHEAVAGYTIGAAWTSHAESKRGTLQPGKLADLVILSRDIFAGSPEVLVDTRVDGTIVGGKWRHRVL